MDQPAKQVLATDIRNTCSGRSVVETIRRCEPERPVWPVSVVVPHVNPKDTLEMASAEDQEMLEAVGAYGPTHRSA